MAEKVAEMSLHKKMLGIAVMAGALQKTKEGYGYKYVPEEDIQAKVTAGLQKYGVMLYNSIVPGTMKVQPISYQKYDPKLKGLKPVNEVLVSGDMTYTWVNIDNPEEKLETTWGFVGQMEDAAQALGAGLTYGNRYYLMKQLQLATSESDPDAYRAKQRQAEVDDEKAAVFIAVKELTDFCKQLVASGFSREAIADVIASCNGGENTMASIKSLQTCEAIFEKLNEMKNAATAKQQKTTTKNSKTEEKEKN